MRAIWRKGYCTVITLGLISVHAHDDAAIHPAFVKLPIHFSEAWKKGEQDAAQKRDMLSFINKYRRGIGDISVGFSSETVSFAWYTPPEWLAYYNGYEARRLYKSEEELKPLKQLSLPNTPLVFDTLHFFGVITLLPSFGWMYGEVTRIADPNDLSDVRVVLKVGDRIIQPVKQPGNLLQHQGQENYNIYVPRVQFNTSTTTGYYIGSNSYSFSGSYYDSSSWGRLWGSGSEFNSGTFSSTTTNTSYYVERVEQGYTWYQGFFFAEFKIVDEKGRPLITEKDKEMTLIVIYGKNERHAKFNLSDLMNPTGSKEVKKAEAESKCIVRIHSALRALVEGNPTKTLATLEQIESTAQNYSSSKFLFALVKYAALIATDEAKAYAFAESILNTELKDNAELLNSIAWIAVAENSPAKNPDYKVIVRLARRACELTNYQSPHILDTLAWALFKSGIVEEALQHQQKAVEIAKQQGLPQEMVSALEKRLEQIRSNQGLNTNPVQGDDK